MKEMMMVLLEKMSSKDYHSIKIIETYKQKTFVS